MTSLAHQDLAQLGGPMSILARQRRDHARLDLLLRRLDETAGADQDRVLGELARLVFRPALRRRLPTATR